MRRIFDWLFFLLRWICYAALIIVITGIGALSVIAMLDVCPTLHEGGIHCNEPVYQSIAEYGMTVLLLTVFTGVPGLLAIAGMVFMIREISAKRRNRRKSD